MRQRLLAWVRDATWRQWLKRAAIAAAAGVGLLVALFVFLYVTVSLPENPDQVQTTLVLDRGGGTMAELYKDENRVDVPLDEVAEVMQQAVLAAEDRNFYEHGGLDPIGIGRALINDLRGRSLQGGSTITQQLVKNAYLSPERSFIRKAKEAVLSVKVEQQWSKEEILERYLNTVYFGRGAYGVEKAAERYFGKRAADLQLGEAALLAGLIRAPGTAEPARAPEKAQQRRDLVLRAMVRTGAIDQAEADAASAGPVTAVAPPDPEAQLQGSTAYFVAEVRRWAIREFGEAAAFGGGLRIETTLDPRLQRAAEEAVFGVLDRPDDPDAALVAMADDGAVVAMIGGKDFATSNVNLAVNRRRPQAGSTFKPFVLAAALEADIPVGTRYPGPAVMKVPFDEFPDYEVRNFDNQGFGTLDLIEATARSVNTVYAQLASETGLNRVATTARNLGVESELPIVPAMSLGAANVSPQDMVRAYMTFANRGERVAPYYVHRVTDRNGDVVFEADPSRRPVFDEEQADVINHVLQQGVQRGTGRAARLSGREVAGKTGTSSDNKDAWFVGYTPKLGAAVWMGYAGSTERAMENVHGREVTGGSFPAQIWQRFMAEAIEEIETGEFEEPPDELLRARRPAEPGASTAPSSTSSTSSSSTSSSVPEDRESTTTTDPDEDASTTTTEPDEEPSTTTSTSDAPPTTTTTEAGGRGNGRGG